MPSDRTSKTRGGFPKLTALASDAEGNQGEGSSQHAEQRVIEVGPQQRTRGGAAAERDCRTCHGLTNGGTPDRSQLTYDDQLQEK